MSATTTEAATIHVEIWSDVVCPWCYVGKRRFEEALAGFEHADEVAVTWRSYQLHPEAPFDRTYDTTKGLARKYGMSEEQAEERQRDLEGLAETVGLEMHLVGGRNGNTRDAHRLLHLANELGLGPELKERLLHGYFTEQRSVFDAEGLSELALEAGLPADRVAEVFADPMLYLDDVVEDIAKAQAYGATGVPFFVVDGRYGVSGAQAPGVFSDVLNQAWSDKQPPKLTTISGDPDAEVCGPDGCEVPGY